MQRRIAVIRIRGRVGIKKEAKDTMDMLRLYKRNTCVVIPNTPAYVGMLTKVKDFTTWGEIDEQTFKELMEKRAKIMGKQPLTEQYLKEKLNIVLSDFIKDFFSFKKELKDIPGLKPFFKLSPPEKGFERKGVKVPFSLGGVLGYRKENINELLKRMI